MNFELNLLWNRWRMNTSLKMKTKVAWNRIRNRILRVRIQNTKGIVLSYQESTSGRRCHVALRYISCTSRRSLLAKEWGVLEHVGQNDESNLRAANVCVIQRRDTTGLVRLTNLQRREASVRARGSRKRLLFFCFANRTFVRCIFQLSSQSSRKPRRTVLSSLSSRVTIYGHVKS